MRRNAMIFVLVAAGMACRPTARVDTPAETTFAGDETQAGDAAQAPRQDTSLVQGPAPQCSTFAAQTSSPYTLPYETGRDWLVIRSSEHFAPGNRGVGLYAIDFQMPIGTPVVAARAGIAVAIQESFLDGNDEDLKENYVFVRHDDGTIARYFHLTQNGALVSEGDSVRRGQAIARSGNSGQSGQPHLHFDVQQCGPNLPPGYNRLPCGRTLPLTFRNTRSHPCGLIGGERYVARDD